MTALNLQDLCEIGQQQLTRMEYLAAEASLVHADQLATACNDYDTLSRLYMPLQECRRQRRLRCGEGVICLDLISTGASDRMDGRHVVENYPHGQLLVAGWGTIEPAIQVRQLQREHGLYVETFLAAAYPAGDQRVVAIVPLPDVKLPPPESRTIDDLKRLLPAHSLVISESELPQGAVKGTPQSYARIMSIWERLHAPFLAAATASTEPTQKINGYRQTIRVDYACESAHQLLSDAARSLERGGR